MSSDVTWFRKPSADGTTTGTLNAVFQLLDLAVIAGRSDQPVLLDGGTTLSHARLLEEVATVGGVLRGLGVEAGTPVAVQVSDARRAVTALLALARLGGVLDDGAAVVVADAGIEGTGAPDPVDWDLVRRAGREDPAPAAELPPDAPWTARRTTLELAQVLRVTPTPIATDALVAVLRG